MASGDNIFEQLGFRVLKQLYLADDYAVFEKKYQAGDSSRTIRYLMRDELFEVGRDNIVFVHNTVNNAINNFSRNQPADCRIRFVLSIGRGNPGSATKIGEREYVIAVDADWLLHLHEIFLEMFSNQRIALETLGGIPVLSQIALKELKGTSAWKYFGEALAWRAWMHAIDFLCIHEIVHCNNGHLDYADKYFQEHDDELGKMHVDSEDITLTKRALEFDADSVSFTNCLIQAQADPTLFHLGDMKWPLQFYPYGQRLAFMGVITALEVIGRGAKPEQPGQAHFVPRRRIMSLEGAGIGFTNQSIRKFTTEQAFQYAADTVGPAMAFVYWHLEGKGDEALKDIISLGDNHQEMHTLLRRRWRRIQGRLNELKLGPAIRLYDDVEPI